MSCDNDCEFWMSETADDIAAKAKLLERTSSVGHRLYWTEVNGATQASKWVTLVSGQKYYIEGRHVEKSGTDHFTVAVEIEHSAKPNHHMAMKEVQEIEATTTQTFEQHKITVTNPDNGEYVLNYLNTIN